MYMDCDEPLHVARYNHSLFEFGVWFKSYRMVKRYHQMKRDLLCICSGLLVRPIVLRGYSSLNTPYGSLFYEVLLFELRLL